MQMWWVAFTEMLPSSASVQLSHTRAMQTASPKHSQVRNTSSELITHTSVRKSLVPCFCPRRWSGQPLSHLCQFCTGMWCLFGGLKQCYRGNPGSWSCKHRTIISISFSSRWNSRHELYLFLHQRKSYSFFFHVKVFIAWREATASAVSACCQQREALTRFQMFQNQGKSHLISASIEK